MTTDQSSTEQEPVQWDEGAPGSAEARLKGCRCPVLDNAYGKGAYGLGKQWWTVADCPLHGYTHDEWASSQDDTP